MDNKIQSESTRILPWLIWGIAALTFFVEYLVRVSPTSMVPELMQSFQTSKLEVSTFVALFVYGYVLMQLPVGVLVDRFGAKITLVCSIFVCAACTALFAHTQIYTTGQIARAIMGMFSAFAFVCTLKLAGTWFSPQRFSVLVGTTQALGMIGAACGAGLMGRMVTSYGWRESLSYFALVLSLLGLIAWLFIRNQPNQTAVKQTKNQHKHYGILDGLKIVLKCKQTWLVSLTAGLLFIPTGVFGEMWGSIFLQTTHNMSPQAANDALSMVFIGWGIGGPLAGMLANRLGRRSVLMLSAWASFLIMPIIFYVPHIPIWAIFTLLFIFGMCNSGVIAAYTMVAELHDKAVSGVALAFSNGMSVIVAGLIQPIIGAIMDWLERDHMNVQIGVFDPENFRLAMLLVVFGSALSIITTHFTKETYVNIQ